jgi:DNA repair exonuclease SbcCD nuclease subunit
MANDFYDDDLIRQRDRATRIKMGPGDEPAPRDPVNDDAVGRGVSELNLTRMARHKQDVDTQATRAMQELEVLRKRQEQLEIEKRELEEFKRKSEEFERGKRDMVANIKRSITALERDEMETQRMLDLLESNRGRFKTLLEDLEDIDEQSWTDETIRVELTRALGVIEDARVEYNKAIAKIDAAKSERPGGRSEPGAGPVVFEDAASGSDGKSFGYWLVAGAGFTLPLVITLVVLYLVYAIMTMNGFL